MHVSYLIFWRNRSWENPKYVFLIFLLPNPVHNKFYQIRQHNCHPLSHFYCCILSWRQQLIAIFSIVVVIVVIVYCHTHHCGRCFRHCGRRSHQHGFIVVVVVEQDGNFQDLVIQVPYVVEDVDEVHRKLGNWTIENRENWPAQNLRWRNLKKVKVKTERNLKLKRGIKVKCTSQAEELNNWELMKVNNKATHNLWHIMLIFQKVKKYQMQAWRPIKLSSNDSNDLRSSLVWVPFRAQLLMLKFRWRSSRKVHAGLRISSDLTIYSS